MYPLSFQQTNEDTEGVEEDNAEGKTLLRFYYGHIWKIYVKTLVAACCPVANQQ